VTTPGGAKSLRAALTEHLDSDPKGRSIRAAFIDDEGTLVTQIFLMEGKGEGAKAQLIELGADGAVLRLPRGWTKKSD
jgi:hypothetical protein